MSNDVSTSVRVLGLFFELLTSERGRDKTRIRRLPGYSDLADAAFESRFQRDKDALRESGVVIVADAAGRYSISRDSFAASTAPLDDTDISLVHWAIQAWNGQDLASDAVVPKLAAATGAHSDHRRGALSLGLTGAQTVARLAQAVRERRVVSFSYASANGLFERAVCPWRLVLRGRALYLWGQDLDRDAERLFRISRMRSQIVFLGEAGDAGDVPEDLPDPFEHLMVAPLLAVRSDATGLAAHVQPMDAPVPGLLDEEWRAGRGDEAEAGEWISAVVAQPDRIIVLEPESLRNAVLARLTAAAQWEAARA